MAEEMIAKGGKMLVPQPGWEYPLASKLLADNLSPNHPGPRGGHAEEDALGEGDMIEEEEKDVEIVAKENSATPASRSCQPLRPRRRRRVPRNSLRPNLDEEKKPPSANVEVSSGSGEMIDDDEAERGG